MPKAEYMNSECPCFTADATTQTKFFAAWRMLTSERAIAFKLCHKWTCRALWQVLWLSFAHAAGLVVAFVAELSEIPVCEEEWDSKQQG